MKRVRCPKCDNFIPFDETKYEQGQTLVFVCPDCKKQFGIRLGATRLNAANQKQEVVDEQAGTTDCGNLLVIENVFGFKQVFPLKLGDNVVGRKNKGTEIDIPIETNDPSMDRAHCVVHVSRNKKGDLVYTLRDNNSVTGTFVMNELLGPKDRFRIYEGSIFTLGATTLILHEGQTELKE